ncbi:MAG: pyridoxal-phosphate dependent enzyme, partial [Actinomycetota bacterium]|nr:pyridoxal-phosphate dependent enzyme [Actinomycetota bacterium]
MDVHDSLVEVVGDTPLVRLRRFSAGVAPVILGKVESLNPGGSVKDRIGLAMVSAAEEAGLLTAGGTIVEPTSGNTGAGLALVAAQRGYRCVFVMPDKMSQEKINLLRAFGAEVVVCPTAVEPDDPRSYYRTADRLTREIPGAFQPNQYFNPGGSVKDRIALAMVEAAERDGLIQPGGTIVEPTSGNTGVGLAIVANQRGYKCVFVMPDKMSAEKIAVLRAYGAEVVVCPTAVDPDHPDSYYKVSDRLVGEIDGAWKPNQYANEHNPESHYLGTGPELWEQTDGRITHFVAGIGTG